MGVDQQFVEKTMKNMIFHDFLTVWGLAPGSFKLLLDITFRRWVSSSWSAGQLTLHLGS